MAKAFAALGHLKEFYSDFERWYWGNVVPGLADGTRKAIQVSKDDVIDGIVIAKRSPSESKLCTLWTSERIRGFGIGTMLFSEALDWLQESCPLTTIPEERMPGFDRILRGQGFALTNVVDSMYRPGAKEYVFNARR